ncbi:hypothetical protein [Paraburkholderia bannensis]|uniref:hypothetical protein n=1 Tax=Paraburkholderia bannensis TaxID=765414 RepID=UPI002ABE3BC1|nr:hypothetical protein [Paraburkholderia bannensis]
MRSKPSSLRMLLRAAALGRAAMALLVCAAAQPGATLPAADHGASAQVVNAHRAPAGAVVAVPAPGLGDERRFMHGIASASAPGGGTWVFFSSSGLPPRGANRDGSWPHDVYVGEWKPGQRRLSGVHIFISRPEAQEPVSVAQIPSGTIFMTFEDGWNAPREVSQRFGVYRQDLKPVMAYPNDVESGGHSGHVAAVGSRFVVFYSQDWVDGGGVDNLGTGGGVYVKVYNGAGKLERRVDVAAHVREWWPMLAGSPTRALLLWQKFIPGDTIARLRYAVLDPSTGELVHAPDALDDLRVEYYTYAAAWVPGANRFLVEASRSDGRSAVMAIDEMGRVTARLTCLPATVREAGIGVDGNTAFVPTRDGRLMALELSGDSITLRGLIRAPFAWGNTGALGIAHGQGLQHFISLSPTGLREAEFNLHDAVAPTAADRCTNEDARS